MRLLATALLIWLICGPLPKQAFGSELRPIPQVDQAVEEFMEKHEVPGLSLAITYRERLIYARGYGFADLEEKKPVTTESRFRIASLSKPITAVAIMKLVEEGELSLDDAVFGPSGLLGTKLGITDPADPVNQISVLHLLQHTSGGWSNNGNDPMFAHASFSADELLLWTLKNRPLKHTPGTTYAYSNFGYFLLGRIIEKITGESYEDYVQSQILAPLKMTTLEIAGNSSAERKPNEATYYSDSEYNPYGFNIRRMDAHGGWIASATDLARFLVHMDGFSYRRDILRPKTIETMTTPSEANPNYASGWAVNQANNWWHVGSLPGTGAIMVRTEAGFNWAILTNKRGPHQSPFVVDLDQIIWRAINDPDTDWPDHDLF